MGGSRILGLITAPSIGTRGCPCPEDSKGAMMMAERLEVFHGAYGVKSSGISKRTGKSKNQTKKAL